MSTMSTVFDVNAWLGSWPFRALRDNTPESLLARLDRTGIDAAAVGSIEAIFHRNAQPANERLAEAVAPHRDRLVPMATINPTYPKWQQDLDACHERLGMAGVRLFPVYHNYAVNGPVARKAVQAAAERGLPVAIPYRMEDNRQRSWIDPGRAVSLDGVAELVAAVPEAAILVPNAIRVARSPLWQRADLREHRWYIDLSLEELFYELRRRPGQAGGTVDHLLEGAGADHVLFGTHLPFSYGGAARLKLALLPVDEPTRQQIAGARAAKLFGWSGPGGAS